MESHSKVSREVNKAQVLMKLSTKREVPYGLSTTKLKTYQQEKLDSSSKHLHQPHYHSRTTY
jgi:hypothetical protein